MALHSDDARAELDRPYGGEKVTAVREMTMGEVLNGLIFAAEQRVRALNDLRDSLPRTYLDQPGSRTMGIIK